MDNRRSFLVAAGSLAVAGPTRAGAQPAGNSTRIDFEGDAPGRPPAGMTFGVTGGGEPAAWSVLQDATAPAGPMVLAQTSRDRTDNRFPLAIFDQPVAADLDVAVRFKPVAGEVDRAAGIALRLTDANNYYVVRANALEDNIRLYKVVKGQRLQFAGTGVKVPTGTWQELRLTARSDRFEVFLNGTSLYSATDATFAQPGRVALWTKADSVSYFDGIVITTFR